MSQPTTDATNEASDIADEFEYLILRRSTEGASMATIATGIALALEKIAQTHPQADSLRSSVSTMIDQDAIKWAGVVEGRAVM